MIWLWGIPDKIANIRIGKIDRNTGTSRFEFLTCKKLDEKVVVCPNIIFERENYLTDVLPNAGRLIIVSKRTLDIMNRLSKTDYQVFEANVFVKDIKVEGYYLLNILHSVDVVDWEKVNCNRYNGIITSIEKFVFKCDTLPDCHCIGRIDDFHSYVAVSQELKEALKKEKIKGVEFKLNIY